VLVITGAWLTSRRERHATPAVAPEPPVDTATAS